MSAHTKKHPTKAMAHINWQGTRYTIPIEVLALYKHAEAKQDTASPAQVFNGLIKTFGEPSLCLSGLRHKESLTQVQFAKKLGITQQNLSAMENGRRPIGKNMAKRIEALFGIDYRCFL